jgi:hypothetical protein
MEGNSPNTIANRSLMPWVLVGSVCARWAGPAVGAPGVAGAVAAERFADDPRLEQKLSMTAWAEPLEDLLGRLSRQTGVRLSFAGRDVGDQRVSLLLRDQPLRRVQALLAETLGLYWFREGKAAGWRYILFEDANSRKQEETLRERARDQFEAGLRRVIHSLIWSPEEVARQVPHDSPWSWGLTHPGRRIAFELLGRMEPGQWERLMATGRLTIPYASLTPADQERVRRYVEAANRDRDERDLQRGTPGRHHIGDVSQTGGSIGFKVFGGVPPGPDSSVDFGVEPADGHVGGSGLSLGYTDAERRQMARESLPAPFRGQERATEREEEPRVTVVWKGKQKPERWEAALQAVSESAGLQVVSDSYLYHWWEWNMDLPEAAALRDRPLAEVLDRVSEPFLYAWRREGDVVLFRQRNWYLEKQHNVPERDLRRWRAHLAAGGRLRPEDLAELAPLTDRQLRNVEAAGVPTDAVTEHRTLLRLYAALNPFQRARLRSAGVGLSEFSAAQRELLQAWKPEMALRADGLLRLRQRPEAITLSLDTGARAAIEERVELERREGSRG